ncbi:uncharacterized protein [Amphiura filiformis]|uniref:uncharacterized protein n=1 Tax=Amphiura filiformis TaxID=82378 RepID=UPI003B20F6F6
MLEGHNVRILDLSYNELETVNGENFTLLTSLQTLNLSHNQLRLVSEMSFIHLTSLQNLDLSYNVIQDVTNLTFTGLNKVETLDLSVQRQLTLHGSPFLSTTSLKKLNIVYGLSSLPPSVFSGLHELQELDIRFNLIESFPDSVFQGLTNLVRLDASVCLDPGLDKPSPIPAALLKDLTSLKWLDISYNQISNLPETLFSNLTSLEYLDLSNNYIPSLPETLFANLINLEYLDLRDNYISSLSETLFVNLTHLTYLDISLNYLTSTPCKAMESLRMLLTLNMSANYFDHVTCSIENMTSLNELEASGKRFKGNDTEYWNVAKWTELITRLPSSLSTLNLVKIRSGVFQSVTAGSMKSSVSFLRISDFGSICSHAFWHLSVEDDAFSIFPYLQNLTILNHCNMRIISTHVSRYAFRGLSHLKSLYLSGIGLTEFPYDALEILAHTLEHLDLSNNNIYDINQGRHMNLGLKSLDASMNPISYVDLGLLGNITNVYLKDAIIISGASIAIYTPFINQALRTIYISAQKITTLYKSVPMCASYHALEEITFRKLQLNSLTLGNCSHLKLLSIYDSGGVGFTEEIYNFPHLKQLTLTNCKLSSINQIFLESASLQYLDLSGNDIGNINRNNFSSLLNLYHLDLSHNALESLPDNLFHHMANLIHLDLTGNKLANLNSLKGLHSLQILLVSGNVLTSLPSFLMKTPYNLWYVEFGDISFACTCDIQPLQHWILTDTNTIIGPQPLYICKSPAVRENNGITEFILDCSLHLENYIAPSVSGLLVICLIVFITYKYRWSIHYKCWTLCCQRRYQRYIDNDDDADINSDDDEDVDAPYEAPIMRRRYHAYVAYHKDNEAWINDQLIPNIEEGPEQFRLCLKERGDIPAGHYILNAICHGIKQSRKTIAVLSANFMDDGWCHYQLHFARMRMVMDNADVLILVQIGEIPDHKKTLLLRQLLCYKEVLKWPEDPIGQELFWNQLKMKLRKPVRVDHRYDEILINVGQLLIAALQSVKLCCLKTSLINLTCLDAVGCSIDVSSAALFKDLTSLEYLDLSINDIANLPQMLFANLISLKHLDLSRNMYQSGLPKSLFTNLINLEYLNLSSTYIGLSNLPDTLFVNLTSLQCLDLSINRISNLPETLFANLTHLTYLDISNNNLSSTPCKAVEALKMISTLNMMFNNFDYITCSIENTTASLKELIVSTSSTYSPDTENWNVTKWSELITRLPSSISTLNLGIRKSHSLQYLNLSSNKIDNINENDFSLLENLIHLDLSHNAIASLPSNQFYHMSSLTFLDLTGNYLANLNSLKDLFGLQTLLVPSNALPTLPTFLMKAPYNLQFVEFGDNPFSCTCDIKPLQDWILLGTDTYIDPEFPYLCKSPAIRENLDITGFSLDCSLHLAYYIGLSVSGILVICLIVFITYKYRWRIHYKCWTLCCQRRYQRYIDNDDDADINSDDEEDVDAPYEAPIMRRRYHAYVAYHKDNEAWINDQLIPNIEDGPERFRLCLKDRGDIPAGHYILNAINHGIKQSRKTIAVLSANFMDDGWCHYQLHFARMQMVMDNADILILVQIGEIPDHKKTLLLRQLLCYKEVLKWPEDPIRQELFWNQLKMKLRKPVRS